MTRTYAQVMKQIEELTKEAEQLRREEVDGVIARIKEAIVAYGLTADDLELNGARRKKTSKAVAKAEKGVAVKFRDDAGNTWMGRGPRPQWLRDALASGKELKDFAAGSP